MSVSDTRTLPKQAARPRALSAREVLALNILYPEWSNSELQMCFETANPEAYRTDLAENTVREIARFEVQR